MKGNTVLTCFTLCIAITFAGCASYTPSLARIDTSEPHVSKLIKGDLAVYVEEYATPEKCKKVFDADLADKGVLPFFIHVQNNGQEPYEVKTMDMTLRKSNIVLKAITPEEAAAKAKRNPVGRALGWSLIVPIISIPIAVAASADHTSKVNKQITQDFAAKSFPEGVIMPNKENSGFIFFQIEGEHTDLSGLTLEMTAQNTVTGETVTPAIPLSNVMLKQRASANAHEQGE
jgi:hypothetical protein